MVKEGTLTVAEIQAAFQKAAENGADMLVHVRYNVFDWTAPYSGPTFPCWNVAEQTIEITGGDYAPLTTLFCSAENARLGGIYDLRAPFDAALRPQDIIPLETRRKLVDAAELSMVEPYGIFDAFRDFLGLFQRPKDEVPTFTPVGLRQPS